MRNLTRFLIVVAVVGVAAFNAYKTLITGNSSDITLVGIEAVAQNENGGGGYDDCQSFLWHIDLSDECYIRQYCFYWCENNAVAEWRYCTSGCIELHSNICNGGSTTGEDCTSVDRCPGAAK